LRPGAVTPFGLLNDREARVKIVLDRQMLEAEVINAHPLHNEATTGIAPADLLRFLELTGHEAILVDFDRLEALEAARRSAGASQ
ncbi:MAG: YbaK/EbsC family protein, partial [Pseudomonadota bacterium]